MPSKCPFRRDSIKLQTCKGEGDIETEAENRVMGLQTKERQQPT